MKTRITVLHLSYSPTSLVALLLFVGLVLNPLWDAKAIEGIDSFRTLNTTVHSSLVSIRLVDENGAPLSGFNASYRSRCGGTWTYSNIPFTTDADGFASVNTFCENNNWDGNVTVIVNKTSLQQSVATNQIFQVAPVYVNLKTCDGTPLSGGAVEQGSGNWTPLGSTDTNGQISFYAFPGTTVVARMRYNFGTNTQSGIVVQFPTTNIDFVTTNVNFGSSEVRIGSSGWPLIPMPYEMLPGNYNFRFNGVQINDVEISGCNVSSSLIRLLDEVNNPLSNLSATYRSRCGGTWTYQGVPFTTDSNGFALVNTTCTNNNWDGKVTVFVNQTSREQSINENSEYQLAKVNVTLRNCEGAPLEGGIVEQGGGQWVNQGITDETGSVGFYAFPSNNIKVRMGFNYGSNTVETTPVIEPVTNIEFTTTKVTIQGGVIQIGSSGWPTIPMPYEMLPGSYNFRIDGIQTNGLEVNGCEFSFPETCDDTFISDQPSGQIITYGENTNFNVNSNSEESWEYQWEVSDDGGSSWNPISENAIYSGTTTSSLSLTRPVVGMSGNRYRVLVTNACGAEYSDGNAELSVLTKEIVVQIAAENKAFDGTTTASVSAVNPIEGLIVGDDVMASTSNGNFENSAVGSGKAVTAEISLLGSDASNYHSNSVATTTASITPAPTQVYIENSVVNCEGTEAILTARVLTENPNIQSEIDALGGTVTFNMGAHTLGTITKSSVDGGVFSGTFAISLAPGMSYGLSASFEPNSENIAEATTLVNSELIVPQVSISSSVPSNANGNIVLFDGAASSLNLPSTTTLTATFQPSVYTGLTYKWYSKQESGNFELVSGATSSTLQVHANGDFVKEYRVELTVDGVCTGSAEFSKIVSVEASCGNGNGNQNKVQVCHLPPGNPKNRKTICVSANAVKALLNNSPGSFVGSCSASYRVSENQDLIVVPWNTPIDVIQKQVSQNWFGDVKTPLKLDGKAYDQLTPGFYELTGDFKDQGGYSLERPISVGVMVQDKPFAVDIELSNRIIGRNVEKGFEIGVLKTIDPIDDIHYYELDENPNVMLLNDRLVWMGDMQSPNTIEVFVHSLDRAGQTISKNIKLNRELELDKLVIYPNPSRDETNLLIPLIGESNVSIQVFDTAGRLVYEETTIQQAPFLRNLNLRAFSSGLYQVIVHTGNRIHTGRIVRE